MNTQRLLQIVEAMNAAEKQFNLQNIMTNEVFNSIQNLASSPTTAGLQESFRAALDRLASAEHAMASTFSPDVAEAIRTLKGHEFFLGGLADSIEDLTSANVATLAVVASRVSEMMQRRQEYLASIETLASLLLAVGVEALPLSSGGAELGVTIPRLVFDNTLDGLQKELKDLNRIIRALSEAATGSVDEAEVLEISTTDPVFVLGLSVSTILMVARSFTWALNTWKQVEDIRKVRADIRKLDIESGFAMAKMAEEAIEKKVRALVGAQVDALLGDRARLEGRPQEQRTDLRMALEMVLDRVQRGVTIEVRLGPPTPSPAENASTESKQDAATFKSLQETSRELMFPRQIGEPLGFLAPPANDAGTKS